MHSKYIQVDIHHADNKATLGNLMYSMEKYAKIQKMQCVRLFVTTSEDLYEIARSRGYLYMNYDDKTVLCFKYIPSSAL